MLYFAYGYNMDPRQIRRRCPTARFLSTAVLPDFELAFTLRSRRRRCGVANVRPSPGKEVHGILYRINGSRDWEVLDAAEGHVPERRYGNRYKKAAVEVLKQNHPQRVYTVIYLGVIENNPPPPSAAYLRQMLAGADHWGLPKAYRKSIADLLPT